MQRILAAIHILLGLAYGAAAAEAGETLWIDVRAPEEYAAGHVAGAINIPHDEIAFRIREVTADKDTVIKVYCGIGVRAEMAKLSLEDQGYRNVMNAGAYQAIIEGRNR